MIYVDKIPLEAENAGGVLLLLKDSSRLLGKTALFLPGRLFPGDEGYFGFLKLPPNIGAARILFQEAEVWAQENGLRALVGPLDISTNYEYGLLVEGFEEKSLFLPWHPPYHAYFLEELGFQKLRDFVVYTWTPACSISSQLVKIARRARDVSGFQIHSWLPGKLAERAALFQKLYNEVMKNNWRFTPLSEQEALTFTRRMQARGRPDLLFLAAYRQKWCGFCFTFVEPAERAARVALLGVLPAAARKGAEALFFFYTLEAFLAGGYQRIEISYVDERNDRLLKMIEKKLKARLARRYRIYRKELSFSSAPQKA